MWYVSPYDVVRVTERRAKEAERRAQIRDLIREAAVDGRGWMPRPICLLLRRAGRLLAIAGRQLEATAPIHPAPVAGHVTAQSYHRITSGSPR